MGFFSDFWHIRLRRRLVPLVITSVSVTGTTATATVVGADPAATLTLEVRSA